MRLLIVGPPGVGKGTQGAALAARIGIPAVSTGDLFRAMRAADGPLAEEVRAVMASGAYVDDALTNRVVVERLLDDDCADGFLLDGYPRTPVQLDHLLAWLADRGQALDAVLALEADEAVTTARMTARAATGGREDDTAEAYRVRLRVYAEQTGPLLDRYEALGLLRRIDGAGGVDEVGDRIRAVFDDLRTTEPIAG